MWKPRFEIKVRNNNKKTTLKEYPYYTSAGGATGFIAQIFLSHLIIKINDKYKNNNKDNEIAKKIYLYESYVSGFNGTESKTDQRREKYDECSPSKYHMIDALESLATLCCFKDEVDIGIDKHLKELNIDYKVNKIEYVNKGDDQTLSKLGIVKDFSPEGNVILVSKKYANAKK